MRNTKQGLSFSMLVACMLSLGGCLESADDVTLFEPGEYKGASDPLLDNSNSAALADRFANQRDR